MIRLAALLERATPSYPNRWRSMEEDPPRVAVLAPAGVWVGIPYDESDARLIAAAPDVAACLIECAAEISHSVELLGSSISMYQAHHEPVDPDVETACQILVAALARLAVLDASLPGEET